MTKSASFADVDDLCHCPWRDDPRSPEASPGVISRKAKIKPSSGTLDNYLFLSFAADKNLSSRAYQSTPPLRTTSFDIVKNGAAALSLLFLSSHC
jgi:hypothetical protein